jgi:hypothetical protein
LERVGVLGETEPARRRPACELARTTRGKAGGPGGGPTPDARPLRVSTSRAAIVTAIEDFNQRRRLAALVRHSGTFRSLSANDEIDVHFEMLAALDPTSPQN